MATEEEIAEQQEPPLWPSIDDRHCEVCGKSHAGLYVCRFGCAHWVTEFPLVMRSHEDSSHPAQVIAALRAVLATTNTMPGSVPGSRSKGVTMIDFDAMRRVMGEAVADRFGILSEEFGDLADAPSLVCMAIEQAGQGEATISDTMSRLLDQWERETYA